MNFFTKYKLRNRSLLYLYWFFSFTGLVIAYSIIKYMKVIYYGDWMFKNLDPYKLDHVIWFVDNHLKIFGYPLFLVIAGTFIIDLVLRKVYVRI